LAEPIETKRRLAAIFAADVEGYSRLMGADEVATLDALTARREILDGLIATRGGRIANTAGDSVLAEFGSAVDAVRCAMEAQAALAQANTAFPETRHINFRMGVHVGDVMVRAGDLFGDGVNIAARLQTLAKAGGICISGVTYDQVRKILPLSFTDLGAQTVKNIEEPIRAYEVGTRVEAASVTSRNDALPRGSQPLPLPDKPSIAVLPFQNMSGDPEQEYFADGMVEDIITALSRFKSLFVIARNSSFTYKGKAADIKQVGRDLGVRYVLEGSVRKAASRVRITAQLIDTSTGAHLWADRFDGATEDVFDLQDQVTTSVVGAITPTLEHAEIGRAVLKPTESLDAYDHYMRAIACGYRWTSEATSEALRHYYKAIELDPKFALAHALATTSYSWRKSNGWMTDIASEIAETERLAKRAVHLDQHDAQVLCWSGAALALVSGDVDAGGPLIERALRLNPNLMDAWLSSGLIKLVLREWSSAVEHFAHAMRLSPFDPLLFMMQQGTAAAYFSIGDYDEAAAWSAKSVGENPNFSSAWRIVAASNAYLDRQEQAQKAILRLRQIEPAVRISTIKYPIPLRPLELAKMEEGLRKAGLPE
jgi:TolB-like protein/class 3 adenylate cyclase/tetratricopeptide (TPR) repeat protein